MGKEVIDHKIEIGTGIDIINKAGKQKEGVCRRRKGQGTVVGGLEGPEWQLQIVPPPCSLLRKLCISSSSPHAFGPLLSSRLPPEPETLDSVCHPCLR